MRLDTSTFAIDLATGQWWEPQSYGRANFAGRCSATVNGAPVFGDDTDGTLWTFGDALEDEDTLVFEWTAAFPLKGGTATVDNVTVDANVGNTELVGPTSEPLIEMATSRTYGRTWGNFRQARLGAQGEYRTRPRWNRVGMFDLPGAMFKFRVSNCRQVRISNVLVNEPGGGRSRA